MRPSGRAPQQIRNVSFTRNYIKHAEGSVLVEFGDTKIICNASVVTGVPKFLKGTNQGWLTAEYGMLPRSTHERMEREAFRGKQSGRTQEIQRLIGRSLRAAVDLKLLGENTIMIDCDVIQADGGTRTASITGATIALHDALAKINHKKTSASHPIKQFIASISVGIFQGEVIVDLDYTEDSKAETDMNVVMAEDGRFIELQGTAEGHPFNVDELNKMLQYAKNGIEQLIALQREALQQ